MRNVIKFLLFILYSSCIFFFPNNKLIFIFVIINLIVNIISNVPIKKLVSGILNFFPFILFTFLINCLLDDFANAIWIGIKLLIVCNITIIYSNTTSILRNSRNNKIVMYAIKSFQN